MENNNNIELVLFSKYSIAGVRQDKLVQWLTTTAQFVIERQYEKTKKIFLNILEATPAIGMS